MRNQRLLIVLAFCLGASGAGIVAYSIHPVYSPSVASTQEARNTQPPLSPPFWSAKVNSGNTSWPVTEGVPVPHNRSPTQQYSNSQSGGVGAADALAESQPHAPAASLPLQRSVSSGAIRTAPSVNSSHVSNNSPGYSNTPGTAGSPGAVQEIIAPAGEIPPVAASMESDPNASPSERAVASNIASDFYSAIEQTGGQSDPASYADKWATARFRADESLRKWLGEDGFKTYTMDSYRKWLGENP